MNAVQLAISAAILVGLTQEIAQLRRVTVSPDASHSQFGKRFAITWRAILSLIVATSLFVIMLESHHVWEEPKTSELLFFEPSLYLLLQVCVIVVLSDSVRRWRGLTTYKVEKSWRLATLCVLALVLTLVMLPDAGLVHFLVHVATSSIEAAQPGKFQRLGTFTDPHHEGFRLFWLTLTAVFSLWISGICLFIANRTMKKSLKQPARVVCLAALMPALGFCVWYYGREFRRVSPDFATAGYAATWTHWLEAVAILAVLTTVGACRISALGENHFGVRQSANEQNQVPVFHETPLGIVLLLVGACLSIYTLVKPMRQLFGMYGSLWEVFAALLRYFYIYPALAILVLATQLFWVRWRHGRAGPGWEIQSFHSANFILNWLSIAMLVALALPTLSAYCFVYWLGPWYLFGSD